MNWFTNLFARLSGGPWPSLGFLPSETAKRNAYNKVKKMFRK
jgi:hypothetical protein